MRLLLVFPRSFAVSYGDMRYVEPLIGRAGLLNVSLATIAALTPREITVRIVDENLDECTLCELCLAAAPAGKLRVSKLYDEGRALERSA